MYMPGRLRTASRPSSTVIEDAPYSLFFVVTDLPVAPVLARCPGAGGRSTSTSGSQAIRGRERFRSAGASARGHRTARAPHRHPPTMVGLDESSRTARFVSGDFRAHCGRNPPESSGYLAFNRAMPAPVDAVAGPARTADSDRPVSASLMAPRPDGVHAFLAGRRPVGDLFRVSAVRLPGSGSRSR